MKYFENVKSMDELKQQYKKLVKKYHPDLNKDTDTTEIMKAINAEYENLFAKFSTSDTKETAAEFIEVLDKIVNLIGLEIEICGSWIWVSGDTYQHKAELKAAGFWWASKKKMWYWHSPNEEVKSNGKTTMAEIRFKYGSQKVESKQQVRLTA